MVDYLVIAVYLVALTLVAVNFPSVRAPFTSPATAHAAGFLVLTLPVLLYFALCEASRYGATPGKRALGIVVLRPDRSRLDIPRSLARTALKLVPWELAHTMLWRIPGWPQPDGPIPSGIVVGLVLVWVLALVYLGVAVADRRNRTPYDLAVDAMVVRAGGERRSRNGAATRP